MPSITRTTSSTPVKSVPIAKKAAPGSRWQTPNARIRARRAQTDGAAPDGPAVAILRRSAKMPRASAPDTYQPSAAGCAGLYGGWAATAVAGRTNAAFHGLADGTAEVGSALGGASMVFGVADSVVTGRAIFSKRSAHRRDKRQLEQLQGTNGNQAEILRLQGNIERYRAAKRGDNLILARDVVLQPLTSAVDGAGLGMDIAKEVGASIAGAVAPALGAAVGPLGMVRGTLQVSLARMEQRGAVDGKHAAFDMALAALAVFGDEVVAPVDRTIARALYQSLQRKVQQGRHAGNFALMRGLKGILDMGLGAVGLGVGTALAVGATNPVGAAVVGGIGGAAAATFLGSLAVQYIQGRVAKNAAKQRERDALELFAGRDLAKRQMLEPEHWPEDGLLRGNEYVAVAALANRLCYGDEQQKRHTHALLTRLGMSIDALQALSAQAEGATGDEVYFQRCRAGIAAHFGIVLYAGGQPESAIEPIGDTSATDAPRTSEVSLRTTAKSAELNVPGPEVAATPGSLIRDTWLAIRAVGGRGGSETSLRVFSGLAGRKADRLDNVLGVLKQKGYDTATLGDALSAARKELEGLRNGRPEMRTQLKRLAFACWCLSLQAKKPPAETAATVASGGLPQDALAV